MVSESFKSYISPVLEEFKGNMRAHDGELTLETKLMGSNAIFDSIGLVSFIVGVEERIEDKTGKAIRLVSEKAMSRSASPFLTLDTLSKYIDELLLEASR